MHLVSSLSLIICVGVKMYMLFSNRLLNAVDQHLPRLLFCLQPLNMQHPLSHRRYMSLFVF